MGNQSQLLPRTMKHAVVPTVAADLDTHTPPKHRYVSPGNSPSNPLCGISHAMRQYPVYSGGQYDGRRSLHQDESWVPLCHCARAILVLSELLIPTTMQDTGLQIKDLSKIHKKQSNVTLLRVRERLRDDLERVRETRYNSQETPNTKMETLVQIVTNGKQCGGEIVRVRMGSCSYPHICPFTNFHWPEKQLV